MAQNTTFFILTPIFKTGTSFNVDVNAGDHGTISNYNI